MTTNPGAALKREPYTFRLDPKVMDRLRATVAGMRSKVDYRFNNAIFLEAAINDYASRLEIDYNDGDAFVIRSSPLAAFLGIDDE